MVVTNSSSWQPAPLPDPQWWYPSVAPDWSELDRLDVSIDDVLRKDLYTIQRVRLGMTPHRVSFCRDWHTLLVYERGSFVSGERRIDGLRDGTPSALDIGIDVIPANSHFEGVSDQGSQITGNLVSFHGTFSEQFFGINSAEYPLIPGFNLRGDLLSPLAARLRELCRCSPESVDIMHVESVLVLLFRELFAAQDNNRAGDDRRFVGGLSSRAQRIVRGFLQENLDQKVDLEMLAEMAGISRFHFTRTFTSTFGMPPYKYLLKLRMQKAIELLTKFDMPITEVALSVGFSCSSEFSRAFKQAMDCTPREFRLNEKIADRAAAMLAD